MSYEYFIADKKRIQLEITTACNIHCLNCDRSCTQAPSNESMSLEQIEKFVNESIEIGWKWENIGLIGGEPTLHPKLFDILKILRRYKEINPNCEVVVITNGYGNKVNEVLSKIPSWVYILNSKKTSRVHPYYTINVAPIDLEEYKNADFAAGCDFTCRCGLGLNKYGYYPCGPGASCDRVFGFNIGIKNLSDVNDQSLKKQMSILCRYCGYYKVCNPTNTRFKKELVTETKTSKSWKKIYERYKKEKPLLSLY